MASTARRLIGLATAARPAPNIRAVRRQISALVKEPWHCLIDVYLRPPGSIPPFELQTVLETNTAGRIIFRNRRRPGFVITFRLHDALNPGYRFPANPLDAVWSQTGSQCPTDANPVWEVFTPLTVSRNGMELVVYNENPRPALRNFKYTLNVVNAAGAVLPLDPGGGNENGNRD